MPSFLLHSPPGRLGMALACVLSLWNTVSAIEGEAQKEKGMNFLPTGIAVSGIKGVKKERDGPVLEPTGSVLKEDWKKEGLAFLASTELPARSVDLSALNLTEVVNRMLSKALKDSRRFFSLLSITSYSSFAFHKVSLAIYNISNLKAVDPAKFPTRFCYCLNNQTNDLSDFTALLVDVMGNSIGSLTEVFRSTSLLSVSQTDESDCIFICVMAGKAGRNLPDFWETAEKSPVVNYTFTSSMAGVLGQMLWKGEGTYKLTPLMMYLLINHLAGCSHQGNCQDFRACNANPANATKDKPCTPSVHSEDLPLETDNYSFSERVDRAHGPASSQDHGHLEHCFSHPGSLGNSHPQHTDFESNQGTSPQKSANRRLFLPCAGDAPAEWLFTPGKEAALVPALHQASRCPQSLLKEGTMTAAPITLAIQKFNPCLMELCRFFQQCLCGSQRRNPTTETVRYCLEYYSWFLKNATFICQKVKRVSHSHTLKQQCLENICKSV
ncbi:HERV-H LTR-associating protein 1 [Erethizon dorsatum]